MIEIFVLAIVLGAYHETAKRRGVAGWPFMLAGLVGWFLSLALVGPGPHFLLGMAWLGLTYLSIFWIGGGRRRMKETWQCPECRCYNDPSTLVCLCGYKPDETSPIGS